MDFQIETSLRDISLGHSAMQMDWPGLLDRNSGVMLRCRCNDSEETSEREGDIRHLTASRSVSRYIQDLAVFVVLSLGYTSRFRVVAWVGCVSYDRGSRPTSACPGLPGSYPQKMPVLASRHGIGGPGIFCPTLHMYMSCYIPLRSATNQFGLSRLPFIRAYCTTSLAVVVEDLLFRRVYFVRPRQYVHLNDCYIPM